VPLVNPPHDRTVSDQVSQWMTRVSQQLNRPKRPVYIAVTEFNGKLADAFLGAGAVPLEQIAALRIVGARFLAVKLEADHVFRVPNDFNVDTNTKIQVVWCTNSVNTAQTATWKVQFSTSAEGEALTTALTDLDEQIIADNVLGPYFVATTPYGLLYNKRLEHGDMLHLKVGLDAVSGLDPAVDEVFLLGILINDEN